MKDYKEFILSKGGKELGILFEDIKEYILPPSQFREFTKFMNGRTTGVFFEGEESVTYCYTGDLVRFLEGLSVID